MKKPPMLTTSNVKKPLSKPGSKRPWNRVNLSVYSISSTDGTGNHNMHIITYATAISMQPKRFVCGIYQGTQTLNNVQANPHFILQLLAATQYRLVDLLGKKSGKSVDKIARLEKRKELMEWNGFKILKNCLAVMEMKVIAELGRDTDEYITGEKLLAGEKKKNTKAGPPPPAGEGTRVRCGDHKILLCDVVAYKNLHDGEVLTLDTLRKHKLIRI
jgi:flavin reductase (DIM6/NTAB) family NADH-FMN oxidoreductase RutF